MTRQFNPEVGRFTSVAWSVCPGIPAQASQNALVKYRQNTFSLFFDLVKWLSSYDCRYFLFLPWNCFHFLVFSDKLYQDKTPCCRGPLINFSGIPDIEKNNSNPSNCFIKLSFDRSLLISQSLIALCK